MKISLLKSNFVFEKKKKNFVFDGKQIGDFISLGTSKQTGRIIMDSKNINNIIGLRNVVFRPSSKCFRSFMTWLEFKLQKYKFSVQIFHPENKAGVLDLEI